jgi:hypothetical protein
VRFHEFLERLTALLDGPAARVLPTVVPNPDFEKNLDGWPSRGWKLQRCSEIKHSGTASLKITGVHGGQNEYLNTTYDTPGSSYEIKWLVPGEKYRLTAWLRVDKLSQGAPGPSVRIQFRDANGSRSSATTNAYDLSQLGVWQRLSVDFSVPDYNTRNYIALNTRTRDAIDAEIYFDDISVVPLEAAGEGAYTYIKLSPEDAALGSGVRLQPPDDFPERVAIQGQGTASWNVNVPAAGTYRVWLRAWSAGSAPPVKVGEREIPAPADIAGPTWQPLGKLELAAGDHSVAITLSSGATIVGGLVLTNDLTELGQ